MKLAWLSSTVRVVCYQQFFLLDSFLFFFNIRASVIMVRVNGMSERHQGHVSRSFIELFAYLWKDNLQILHGCLTLILARSLF